MYIYKASVCSSLLCSAVVLAQASTDATPTNPCAPGESAEVVISTQDDIDLIADCAVLAASLTIKSNQSLTLPNLVTVEGSVTIIDYVRYLGGHIVWRQLEENDQDLLNISIPRLESIGRSINSESTTLGTLDLPSLSAVEYISLGTPNLTTWTGTNSLQAVYQLHLTDHRISKLEFGNLFNISEIWISFQHPSTLYLNGTLTDSIWGSKVKIESYSNVSITSDLQNAENATYYIEGCRNITLNAESVGGLDIHDNPELEHLSVPYLTHISNASESVSSRYTGRLYITSNDRLQSIDFPSLVVVDDELNVANNLQLQAFGEGFPALKSVGSRLRMEGNLTSFHLPNSVKVGEIVSVESTNDSFNCSTVAENFSNGTDVSCDLYDFTSTSDPEKHKPALSYAAKIGLGVGLAVFVVLALGLGCGFCLWRSHRHPDQSGRAATISSKLLRLWAKESFQKKPPGFPLQDLNRRDGDEPLPSYQPRVSSTATTLAPGRDGNGDGDAVSRPGSGRGHGNGNGTG